MTDDHSTTDDQIAIIGIGCRLPGGASDYRTFWQNLIAGKDCLTPTPPDRYDVATLGSRDKEKPGRLVGGRGGYIDGFDEFDPAFFGISPREAEHMDPQQRKLLEVAWEALEDGGQKPAELAGSDIGVFVGAFTLDYKILQFADLSFETLAAHTATGTMMTMVSNRISYCFDFRGPSMSIDTACSSSLVALHLACQSLRRGETGLALAGGTLLHMTPQYTIAETKGGFLSPEGRSRTFDATANGYVRAEGVGLVALKRLADAVRDNDPIHAVVIGTGVNQDGRSNGITVPNPDAQVRLIEQVCAGAGIRPGDLQYVEAHGTSTPVGDPIEANALGRALSVGRKPDSACYVGSVKTNIGHTEAAAGIAGLIKTVLSLQHRIIPPHINLEQVNPDIDLAALPFQIPTEPTAWPERDGPALAGVNSFGFGGTNAHVLLTEAPPRAGIPQEETPAPGREYTILPLTARDEAALPAVAEGIRSELAGGQDPVRLRDLGYTLAHRRQHLESRLSVLYSSAESLDERLAGYLRGETHPHVLVDRQQEPSARRLVWVFTGMGPQWWAMGRQLFETEPVYRDAIERCDREIRRAAGWSLIDELAAEEADSQMGETWLAQPANFAVQIGLAALWRAQGVSPDAIVGHSTGEIAAFYEAGVYDLPDAIKVVLHRSRLQQKLVGTGTMLAVSLSEEEAYERVRPYRDRISVAAVNSPTAITLAGDADALAELADALRAEQVFAKFLAVRVPYHSARMEMIKDELLSSLADLRPRATQVPLYLTGQPGRAQGPELDAQYWWRNVRDSVRFRAATDQLIDDGYRLFLEIGPHPVLGRAVQECLADRGVEGRTVASIRRAEDEPAGFMTALATLHNLGVEIAWDALHPAGRTVPLPRYPFKRDRYWVEPRPVEQVRLGRRDHPLLGRRLTAAAPTWQATIDAEAMPYLGDHRIQGNVLFPAAGYLEMAAQAVRAITGGTTAALADIELRKALFLSDREAKTVQLALSPEDGSVTVATVPGDGAEPTVHATCAVRAGQRRRHGPPLDLPATQARSERRLDRPACYAALAEIGYHYGPAFQGIEAAWISEDEAVVRICPPDSLAGEAAGYHVHPAILDACFQALLTPLILDRADSSGTGIRLPLSIAEIVLEPVGDQPLWVHATISRRDGDELVGNIAVYADDGAPLGRIGGLRAVDVEKVSTAVGLHTIDGWLTEVTWVERPLPPTAAVDHPGHLLVFADRDGVGEELAALVTAAGGRCLLVRPGERFALDRDRRTAIVEPGSTADLRRLLTEVRADHPEGFDAFVHLWNLDAAPLAAATREELDRHTTAGAYSLIALGQSLLAEQAGGKLHVVTRAAQAVSPDEPVEPLGAPAWGIARVLWYQELTAHRGKVIDLGPASAADPTEDNPRRVEAEVLLRELTADDEADTEHEIALRGDRRYAARLAPAAELTRPLPLRLRADGSYLVTGAFGALGRLLSRTLVRRGARRLILAGRTELPARDQWHTLEPGSRAADNVRFVRELEASGAQPILATLDVTDEAGLARWLDDYRRQGSPPIRGVFHLAGQVRDTLLPELDRDVFDTVYDPKTVGAYLLHRQLADQPLDHFVLFASVASLLTTAGQTNYAAGNAFLDALAHHRRASGLPALSLDWGPWATGMIEELGLIEHYRHSRGMTSLSPEAGMSVLERVIGQDRAQLLIATIADWPVFLSWYDSPPPLVAELATTGTEREAGTGSLRDTFRDTDAEGRRQLVADYFTDLVRTVLRVPAEQVDLETDLGSLGLDSLLAMELRARIAADLGVALPVVALLSGASVGALAAQVRDGLVQLVEASEPEVAAGVVARHEDERQYPLTQNQQALWFLKQLNPDGFAYNIGGAVEVRAELDPDLMFDAVRLLITRHPTLRANFVLDHDQPVQRISESVTPDLGLFDVQDRQWDEIYHMIIDEYRKPYDLERDPLLRFRLFKRGPDRWVIMKAVHHIISDAISTFTFIEELLEVYEGLRRGEPAELAPVRARYLDFLNWQNRYLASPAAQQSLAYWRSHLPAEIPVLDLPTDRPRPLVQSHNGASEFFVLDSELSARVHAVAREHNVTAFMVLLSAYYLMLHRYSGQDDLIVGSPVTGRTQDEFASVYGYFVNPLPLHLNLAGGPSVAAVFEQVRAAVLGGLDHQEYPFVLLVDELGLQHDPSRSAVFQAMFILLTHKVATEKYGYRLDYIELPEEEGQFDLTLSAYQDLTDEQFHCVFKYNTDLFEPETVQRMAAHYVNLLDAVTRAPAEESVTQLTMTGPDERSHILEGWSGAGRHAVYHEPVPQLITRIAGQRPDATAVTVPAAGQPGAGRRLSYGELEQASGRLAGALREWGVRPGTVVALCLDKSPELIVALLAVLRAGGAYLPLDPENPPQRLEYMVRTAGATLVLTDDRDRTRLADLPATVTSVAELSRTAGTGIGDTPIELDSPAYVVYTSGSTGLPKAVQVSHRNLASVYAAWRDEYRLEHDVRVHLQLASPSFDVFTGDLVRALCSGGNLVLVDRDLLFDTARLYQVMLTEQVDAGEFVPAVIRQLMSYCEREGSRLDFMRLLVVGSDTWKVGEYQRLHKLGGPQTRVINSYGLSEATIDSAYFEGPVDGLDPSRTVPIGTPLPNSALYLLDPHGTPVPAGVPGELWVGGDGVALGYVGDPAQTAHRFPTLALHRGPDAVPERLYRTGDLARWDATGRVHLLGRLDTQVKVRGHRIEVGEVESHLTAWPALEQAVVTVVPDGRGEPVLAAYCVPAAGAEFDPPVLRRHLAGYLPTFMIPSYLVELPELPLSPNGKVDLSALPAPATGQPEQAYEPPVTLYETRMADHWATLLGLDRVGLQHDFFESGGSSIKLMELIYHLQAEFGITIPVSQLFTATTLQGMARSVQDIVSGDGTGARPYLEFNPGAGRTVFCFPPAGGHGLVYRQLAGHLPEYRLVALNYLTGVDKVAGYADLVEAVPGTTGGFALLGYSLGGNLAFEVAKELERRGRQVDDVVIVDSYRIGERFELDDGRLAAFEEELAGHLRRHTGSEIVASETADQAREYLRFCGQTPNVGTVAARVSVISDHDKVAFYAAGERGTWQGSSTTQHEVHQGFGSHAEMLDGERLPGNSGLIRDILQGGETHAG